MIQAVIFDMDGLLIDSEPFWRQAKVDAMTALGHPITLEQARQTTGLRIDEIAEYWLNNRHLDRSLAPTLANDILQRVQHAIQQYGELLPGVQQVLTLLQQHHIPMALASSSALSLIETVLDRFALHRYFHTYCSAQHQPLGKPHPGVYLNTAEALGVSANACLAVEDSITGLIAAKAARMMALAVPEPSQFNDPRYALADIKLASLEQFDGSLLTRLLSHAA